MASPDTRSSRGYTNDTDMWATSVKDVRFNNAAECSPPSASGSLRLARVSPRASDAVAPALSFTSSRVSVPRPHSHRLPGYVLWAVMVLTALGVALANVAIVAGIWALTRLGARIGQEAMARSLPLGGLALALYSGGLALAASLLVVAAAPLCAGGGLPEIKSYLNGGKIPGVLTWRTLVVRLLALVLACSSSLPVGREGPSIAVGCNIGFGVMQALALPHARRWLDLSAAGAERLTAQLLDEERLAFAKRIGCTLGGAAGMATIFNAPVGGLLYMLEEVTVNTWAPEATLRAFICTSVACLANQALLNLAGSDVTSFLIFVYQPDKFVVWHWLDMPIIVVFAAAVGLCCGLYIRVVGVVVTWRRNLWAKRSRVLQPWGKVVEASLYAAMTSSIFFGVAIAFGRCLGEEEQLGEVLRFNCPEGQSNFEATMLFGGAEEVIKLLYSRGPGSAVTSLGLLAVLLAYLLLNVGMMGVAVPMGAFIPNMFLGAVAGRLFGHLLRGSNIAARLAEPGIYSLLGSAAFLGGSLRQSLSIVVFLMECVNNIDVIPPLMVTIFVAHYAAKSVSERGLDEEIIHRKGISYLEDHLPKEMEKAGVVAKDLCVQLPPSARLAPRVGVEAVQRALRDSEHGAFPVLEGGRCVGLITRKRLLAAVRATEPDAGGRRLRRAGSLGGCPEEADELRQQQHVNDVVRTGAGTGGSTSSARPSADCTCLPLSKIMDPAPYLVMDNMPAARVVSLFTRLGLSAACAVAPDGSFTGVLSRASLVEAIGSYEDAAGHGEQDPAKDGRGGGAAPGAAAAPAAGAGHGDLEDLELGRPGAAVPPAAPPAASPPPAPRGEAEADAVARLEARVAELEALLHRRQASSPPRASPRVAPRGDAPAAGRGGAASAGGEAEAREACEESPGPPLYSL